MKPTDPHPEANPLLDQLLAEAGRENERMHLAQADKYMRYAPQPEALASPLEADEHGLLDKAGIPSTEPDGMGGSVFLSLERRIQLLIDRKPAEPYTLTRGPHSVQADTMMGVYCRGNALEIPLPINWDGWQRVANYANRKIAESLSLSPSTRPSGEGS